jgi:hypothetical protein
VRYVRFEEQGLASWGILINDETIQPLSAHPIWAEPPEAGRLPCSLFACWPPAIPVKIVARR